MGLIVPKGVDIQGIFVPGNSHAAVMAEKADQVDGSWALASLKCSQSQSVVQMRFWFEISKGLQAGFCS